MTESVTREPGWIRRRYARTPGILRTSAAPVALTSVAFRRGAGLAWRPKAASRERRPYAGPVTIFSPREYAERSRAYRSPALPQAEYCWTDDVRVVEILKEPQASGR